MKTVKLLYFDDAVNFGDMLNPVICERIFGVKAAASEWNAAEAVFIGSLLESALYRKKHKFPDWYFKMILKKPAVVWGTGFMFKEYENIRRKPEAVRRRLDIYGVRGYLSLKRLQAVGGGINFKARLPQDKYPCGISVGDPGLLSNMLLEKTPRKKYSLGIIPHYIDKNIDVFGEINKNIKNSVIIDIECEPVEFLLRLSECSAVIASAMHALIAADSIGIPNIHILASGNVSGGIYKYLDYYSALDIPHAYLSCERALNLSANNELIDYITSVCIRDYGKINDIRDNIIKTFPY